jgi:putative membrane protein
MQLASRRVTAEDRAAISQAVADAESKTSSEIVPIVATSSGRYDRAEDVAGLWLGILALAATWFLWPRPLPEAGSWDEWPEWIELAALAVSVLLGFVAGAVAASHIGWLRRLFTPRAMLRKETQARAHQAFFDERIYRTEAHNGLLIYVSLFERQSVILGDTGIVERVGQAALDALCRQMTDRLRHGSLREAFCETIRAAGQQLAPVLPRQANHVNELPDALVILDRPL